MNLDPWAILGVEACNDSKLIKQAYLRQVKIYKPEVDPAGFQRVRNAYEQALLLVDLGVAWNDGLDEKASGGRAASDSDWQDFQPSPSDLGSSSEFRWTTALFERIAALLTRKDQAALEALLEEETHQPAFWSEPESLNQLNVLLVDFLVRQGIPPGEMTEGLARHLEWRTRLPPLSGRIGVAELNAFLRNYTLPSSLVLTNAISQIFSDVLLYARNRSADYVLECLRNDIYRFLGANPEGRAEVEARIFAWLGEVNLDKSLLLRIFYLFDLTSLPEQVHLLYVRMDQCQLTLERLNQISFELTGYPLGHQGESAFRKCTEESVPANPRLSDTGRPLQLFAPFLFIVVAIVVGVGLFFSYTDPSLNGKGLSVAIRKNQFEDFTEILAEGVSRDELLPEGDTPLMLATKFGRANMVQFLLEHGALTYRDSKSLLMTAIRRNDYETLLVLLENGIDPNTLSEDGTSPLFAAVVGQKMEMVKLLIDHGVNLEVGNPAADMARNRALGLGHQDLIQLLAP